MTQKIDRVKNIEVADYVYDLPEERIAYYPAKDRSHSKVLVWKNDRLTENRFEQITEILPEKSLLVFNTTKVIPARMIFKKQTGALIEVFCLEPFNVSYPEAMAAKGSITWICMIGNSKKWKNTDETLTITQKTPGNITLKAKRKQDVNGKQIVTFQWDDTRLTFSEILSILGRIPLPPYIKREIEVTDVNTYQTVFAKQEGSVAAPTAGLHFTNKLLTKLKEKHAVSELILHVGAGTFKPLASNTISKHQMHREYVSIPKKLIQALLEPKSAIVPVGTTSVRSLESLFWLGVKHMFSAHKDFHLMQWEAYQLEELYSEITAKEVLAFWLNYLELERKTHLSFYTELIIAPEYSFQLTDGMITNFHQPASTLLLLIAAFTGNAWRDIYRYALENDFRFLSYGDACCFFK